jgi:uncharacterized protein (DUF1778 family)
MKSTARRAGRLELRLSPANKRLLKRAAALRSKTVSSFLLDSGISAAQEVLANRTEFRLSAGTYDDFVAALDAPSKAKPRLDDLLGTPSALE